MIVRGLTVGHGGYGFIMGYLMGKGEATSSKASTALGFVVPWLMHGLYDYSLSESMAAFDTDIRQIIIGEFEDQPFRLN